MESMFSTLRTSWRIRSGSSAVRIIVGGVSVVQKGATTTDLGLAQERSGSVWQTKESANRIANSRWRSAPAGCGGALLVVWSAAPRMEVAR